MIFLSVVPYREKVLKTEPLTVLGSQQREHNCCVCSTLQRESFKDRTFDSSGFSTEGALIFVSVIPYGEKVLKREPLTALGSQQRER